MFENLNDYERQRLDDVVRDLADPDADLDSSTDQIDFLHSLGWADGDVAAAIAG